MTSRENELGGLWLKEGRNGAKYMSGRLTIGGEQVEVVVFKNQHKLPGERTPDYRVYRSEPMSGQQQTSQPPRRQQRSIADDLDDNIPF